MQRRRYAESQAGLGCCLKSAGCPSDLRRKTYTHRPLGFMNSAPSQRDVRTIRGSLMYPSHALYCPSRHTDVSVHHARGIFTTHRSSFLKHLIDTTLFQRFLCPVSLGPPTTRARRTVKHVLYCLNSGSHSSLVAVFRRYSTRSSACQ